MKTYISILRGINVSGQRLIKMKALQELYAGMGFANVRTYIQSGNVIFETKPTEPAKLAASISSAILKVFGFEVPVIVLDREALTAVSGSNNFILCANREIDKLHVTFLATEPEPSLKQVILSSEYLPDEFYIENKAVYLYCPNGYGNTKLNNNFFEKKLRVQATTRNWKTVLELVKLSA
jgi:uncharacterized protein (DUF1697 family)